MESINVIRESLKGLKEIGTVRAAEGRRRRRRRMRRLREVGKNFESFLASARERRIQGWS